MLRRLALLAVLTALASGLSASPAYAQAKLVRDDADDRPAFIDITRAWLQNGQHRISLKCTLGNSRTALV
jgi:hypothetical protein